MIEPMEKMPPEDAPYVLPTEVWDALWAHLTEADCECDDSTGHKCQACALVRKLESLKTMPLPAEAQPPEAEPSPKVKGRIAWPSDKKESFHGLRKPRKNWRPPGQSK